MARDASPEGSAISTAREHPPVKVTPPPASSAFPREPARRVLTGAALRRVPTRVTRVPGGPTRELRALRPRPLARQLPRVRQCDRTRKGGARGDEIPSADAVGEMAMREVDVTAHPCPKFAAAGGSHGQKGTRHCNGENGKNHTHGASPFSRAPRRRFRNRIDTPAPVAPTTLLRIQPGRTGSDDWTSFASPGRWYMSTRASTGGCEACMSFCWFVRHRGAGDAPASADITNHGDTHVPHKADSSWNSSRQSGGVEWDRRSCQRPVRPIQRRHTCRGTVIGCDD
jgi:hypothetical protein